MFSWEGDDEDGGGGGEIMVIFLGGDKEGLVRLPARFEAGELELEKDDLEASDGTSWYEILTSLEYLDLKVLATSGEECGVVLRESGERVVNLRRIGGEFL